MTNFENLKQMSIDELASKLEDSPCKFCVDLHRECNIMDCVTGIKKWLEQEVSEDV